VKKVGSHKVRKIEISGDTEKACAPIETEGKMITIPGYGTKEKSNENETTLIYKAFRKKDHLPVILKVLKNEYPTHRQLAQYRSEYEIINPSNIICNPETGELKIIDFGISTILARENPTVITPGVLEGTPENSALKGTFDPTDGDFEEAETALENLKQALEKTDWRSLCE